MSTSGSEIVFIEMTLYSCCGFPTFRERLTNVKRDAVNIPRGILIGLSSMGQAARPDQVNCFWIRVKNSSRKLLHLVVKEGGVGHVLSCGSNKRKFESLYRMV